MYSAAFQLKYQQTAYFHNLGAVGEDSIANSDKSQSCAATDKAEKLDAYAQKLCEHASKLGMS